MNRLLRSNRWRPFSRLSLALLLAEMFIGTPASLVVSSASAQSPQQILERDRLYADAYRAIEQRDFVLAHRLLQRYSQLAQDVFNRHPGFKRQIIAQLADLEQRICGRVTLSAARSRCCVTLSATRNDC